MLPVFALILIFIYTCLCAVKYNDALFYLNGDLISIVTLLIAAFSVAEVVAFRYPFEFKKRFKKKMKLDSKPKEVHRFLKHFTIFVETIVIILLVSSVNNAVVFTENKVYFPENKYISLRQEAIRYEHFDTVYKVEKYYHFGVELSDFPHYILVSKNGKKIALALYPANTSEDFEKKVLPLFIENGCEIIEIESERDIK